MLKLEQVSKAFGSLQAVDSVSFELAAGEIFGLLGPNGAGKSTTVMMIAGQLEPDSGRVDVAGMGSPETDRVREKIGIAPQSLSLYDDLTGLENLRFFGRMQGLSGDALDQAVDDALSVVNLRNRAGDRVKNYSGGMQRRLNLAVALLHDPQLLLLDEPTVGVDPQSRNAILDNIEVLRQSGRGLLYTTHYMEEVERICDRVGIMDSGKLLALDTVDGLVKAHGGPSQLKITDCEGETRAVETQNPLKELKAVDPDRIQDFQIKRPNLETVFLNLTGRALRD